MIPTVIIWGADNYNTLGVLRQLAKGNIETLLLINGANHHCATESKYCKNVIFTKSYNDGLKYLLSVSGKNAILIPTGDNAAEIIDKNKNVLSSQYILMGTSEAGLLSKVDDKNYMTELAKKCGFTVPRSMFFTSAVSVENLPMPCILKPVVVKEGTVKEFKTKIISSVTEFKKFKKVLNPNNTYILQELIPKTFDILVYGCRFKNGEVVFAGQYIKDRWSDDGGGSHGLLTKELPQYLNLKSAEKLLKTIDYKGLFSIEYGLVGNTAYFYEINLRNDGTSHLFFQAGANLPLAWVYDCINDSTVVSKQIIHDGWNINELYDISNVFHGNISYKQYKKDKCNASIFHYYSPDDPRPWKFAKCKALYDLPFRSILLKYRPTIVKMINQFKR